jgi:phosphoribosylaminoimidazolecarboxamide formyltransferase/IMP cyclohydrolase
MFIGCIVVKYLKSNAVLFMKDGQMISAGYGQTSRVRALKQAIIKAHDFGFSVKGAVLASDAFFPYDDCAKIAGEEQVGAIVQPGGSVKDQDSIVMCNYYDMPMVFTGVRHFKH